LIERFTQRKRPSEPIRPTAPPPSREWIAVLAFFALIVLIDRGGNASAHVAPWAFLIYLVAVVYTVCWAGLRPGMLATGLLVAYAWAVNHFHFSPAYASKDPARANGSIIFTAIFFSVCAIITGVVQEKLRASAIREFDAWASAENESKQRRLAEAELWASEEMRRMIIESSVDAMIGMSEEGRITMWNPNAERLFGWSQDEAMGCLASERIVVLSAERSSNAELRRFLSSGEDPILRDRIELVARTKSGSEVSVEIYIADNRTEKGSVYILFARDISDRKRAEQAIQELNSSLEARVVERTKLLEAANEELVGFTYSVSHDLRAPLRAIVSNSQIVCEEAKDSLDEESFERLQRLEHNARKMAEIIDHLLQYARIGQVELKLTKVDLSEMAMVIGEDLTSRRSGKVDVQPGLITYGDPELIRMVMFNLMENAWKYVAPGQEPAVEVGKAAGGMFFVRDHGIGFDMKYVDTVWKPFERLHRDTEYPGTGIGLANCKRIVTRHGGNIWTESVPGKGTTMFFAFGAKASPEKVTARSRAGV